MFQQNGLKAKVMFKVLELMYKWVTQVTLKVYCHVIQHVTASIANLYSASKKSTVSFIISGFVTCNKNLKGYDQIF
jgi:hypothetical protein